MTKTKQLHALNTFKPYAVFYRTGGQIESSILLMVGALVLLTMTEVMADPKDSTNWQKLTLQGISLTILLKVT